MCVSAVRSPAAMPAVLEVPDLSVPVRAEDRLGEATAALTAFDFAGGKLGQHVVGL